MQKNALLKEKDCSFSQQGRNVTTGSAFNSEGCIPRRVLQIKFRDALKPRYYTTNEIIACERTHFSLDAVIILSENFRHSVLWESLRTVAYRMQFRYHSRRFYFFILMWNLGRCEFYLRTLFNYLQRYTTNRAVTAACCDKNGNAKWKINAPSYKKSRWDFPGNKWIGSAFHATRFSRSKFSLRGFPPRQRSPSPPLSSLIVRRLIKS